MKLSEGANIIKNILIREGVSFELEYNFVSKIREKTARCRFDFAVLNADKTVKYLIEYDSELHFQQIAKFHKTRQDFLAAQERDRQKNVYCLANYILLYRVPYWEVHDLKTIKDIQQNRFLVKNKFHNDFINPSLKK